jgi:hypothetical protein
LLSNKFNSSKVKKQKRNKMAINGHAVEGAFTGSISKIFTPTDTTIHTIAFGVNTTPHTPTTSRSGFTIPAGTYLDGPIIQYSASAITIAYTHDYAQKVSGSSHI